MLGRAGAVRRGREAIGCDARARWRPEGTSTIAIMPSFEGDALPPEEAVADFLRGSRLERDDSVLGPKEGALRRLGMGGAELRAMPRDRWTELALERVALLDLGR